MRLLLDTHILIALLERRLSELPLSIGDALAADNFPRFVSVASLWEIAIKSRLGRLPLSTSLDEWPAAINRLGLTLLVIDDRHVLMPLDPEPVIRDPFDRLLLGICAADSLRLLTLDRALLGHPLTWRGVPSVKK
jgi:PIN domain nuclease of toxin-antitoxin system